MKLFKLKNNDESHKTEKLNFTNLKYSSINKNYRF